MESHPVVKSFHSIMGSAENGKWKVVQRIVTWEVGLKKIGER